jgi:hypothetical protein
MYIPLVKFVLVGRHEELEGACQPPCIVREMPQAMPQTLSLFLYVLGTPDKLVILVQQLVARSIQLLHHLCHPTVPTGPSVPIGQLIIRTPARWTGPHRAEAIDGNLCTIHAERIQICTHTSHLPFVNLSIYS